MTVVIFKPLLGVLMLFYSVRILSAQTYRNMSTLAGIHSAVFVTTPSAEVAKTLARGLVQGKLVACVNVIPQISSIYEWKNELIEDTESLMMIKTRTDTVDAVTKYIKEHHPYEICEVISLPIQNGNEDYLNWISKIVPSINERNEKKL